MQIPVIVEPLADRPGYRAKLGDPFNMSSEAETVDEAVRQLNDLLDSRRRSGLQIRAVSVGNYDAIAAGGGWLPDDELTREWRECVEEYRRECDREDRARILGEDEKADGP